MNGILDRVVSTEQDLQITMNYTGGQANIRAMPKRLQGR